MTIDAIWEPFSIHLGLDDSSLVCFGVEARAREMSVIELDLSEVPDTAALSSYLAGAFMFPHETRGLDAAVDLISDLEWFGNVRGYVIIARGLRNSSTVSESFGSLLPNIVDRWRSKGIPFVVAIEGTSDRLLAALRAANDAMERAGRLPWAQPGTGAVDLIVHRPDRLSDGWHQDPTGG